VKRWGKKANLLGAQRCIPIRHAGKKTCDGRKGPNLRKKGLKTRKSRFFHSKDLSVRGEGLEKLNRHHKCGIGAEGDLEDCL